MRYLALIAVPMFLAACQSTSKSTAELMDSNSATASAPTHVDATHCEIFVDKVTATIGSHGALSVFVYIKVLKDHILEGEVTEVGFRSTTKTTEHGGGDISVTPWDNQVLASRSPVGDYYTLPAGLMVDSDFNSSETTGVYYVKTSTNHYYWAKPQGGGNFLFTPQFGDRVYSMYGLTGNYYSDPGHGIPTQGDSDLRFMNPQDCH